MKKKRSFYSFYSKKKHIEDYTKEQGERKKKNAWGESASP